MECCQLDLAGLTIGSVESQVVLLGDGLDNSSHKIDMFTSALPRLGSAMIHVQPQDTRPDARVEDYRGFFRQRIALDTAMHHRGGFACLNHVSRVDALIRGVFSQEPEIPPFQSSWQPGWNHASASVFCYTGQILVVGSTLREHGVIERRILQGDNESGQEADRSVSSRDGRVTSSSFDLYCKVCVAYGSAKSDRWLLTLLSQSRQRHESSEVVVQPISTFIQDQFDPILAVPLLQQSRYTRGTIET